MAVKKRSLLVAAILLSQVTARYVPGALIWTSSFWTASTLFFALFTLRTLWSVAIYPRFLDPLRGLPQAPDGSFWLGHFNLIRKQPTGEPQRDWIDHVPNDGVIVYHWFMNEPRVLLTTPKALAEVLVQRSYEFVKPQRMREGLGHILGVGVLLAEGDEHKRQRKALMPAFAFRHIKDLYPVFWAKSRELVEVMSATIRASGNDAEKGTVLQARDWVSRATLDLIGSAGCGKDFDSVANPDNELSTAYRLIFQQESRSQHPSTEGLRLFFPLWLVRRLPVQRNRELNRGITLVKQVAYELIQTKRARLAKGERTDVDMLSVAMQSGGFSDEDLVNQLMTFLAAGHETTASGLSWALYLLCRHPDVQTRLRAEIRAGLPTAVDAAASVTSVDIDRLQYLSAVIHETMRLFPPAPMSMRTTVANTTIQGHYVPKGTSVVLCPWAINTSKELWGPDARAFRPDRWMAAGCANTGGAASNYAYATFLHGPRSCIGRDFAKAEFACLLAALVGRFSFELADPGWELRVRNTITASPKGGLELRIREIPGW